jgi:hypothetical protein
LTVLKPLLVTVMRFIPERWSVVRFLCSNLEHSQAMP